MLLPCTQEQTRTPPTACKTGWDLPFTSSFPHTLTPGSRLNPSISTSFLPLDLCTCHKTGLLLPQPIVTAQLSNPTHTTDVWCVLLFLRSSQYHIAVDCLHEFQPLSEITVCVYLLTVSCFQMQLLHRLQLVSLLVTGTW